MIKSDRFAIVLICFGLLLLSASFLWPWLLPQKVVWNEEQALEKATAAADLHRMTHVAAETEISNIREEEKEAVRRKLQAAQDRFDNSKSALDRARRMRDITAQTLRWTGVLLTLVGVVRYQMIRSDDRNQRPQRR